MITYEKDNLVIPKKIMKMSVEEIKKEKAKILRTIKCSKATKKTAKAGGSKVIVAF